MEKKREYKLPETLRELTKKDRKTGKKITYKEIAEAIGIRQQTISQYAKGETVPTAKHLFAMADFFGVSVDYLLIGYEDGSLYFAMMDAQRRRMAEKLQNLATLCSNAENIALGLMESEGRYDV